MLFSASEAHCISAGPASTVSKLFDQQQQQESRGQKGAAECDEVIGSLRNARNKAEARQRSKFAETTLYERAAGAVKVAATGVRTVVMFTVSLPGKVASFIALPKEERQATYKRLWIATKKEANHYWVSCRGLPRSFCPEMMMKDLLAHE